VSSATWTRIKALLLFEVQGEAVVFEMDCFCNQIILNAESEQVPRMTSAFGSFGETKEQNELQISNLKTVRLRREWPKS